MKRVCLSIVAVVTTLFIMTAEAVNLSLDSTGQVLLYPYYNVNQGNVTFVSVTNTTATAKAVKVRFREAAGGESVFDFTLYLSPRDVWVGAVTKHNGAVRLSVPLDTSCTLPDTATLTTTDFSTSRIHSAYTGDVLERISEGHIEIIELAELPTTDGASDIVDAITHDQAASPVAPVNCTVPATFNDTADLGAILDAGSVTAGGVTQDFQAPGGGLMGNAAIFNASSGIYFPYNATALRAFATNPIWWPQNSEAFTHVEGVATEGEDSAGNAISNYRTADRGSTVPSENGTLNRDLPDLSTPSVAEVTADSSVFMVLSHAAETGEPVIYSGTFGGSVPDAKYDKTAAVSAALLCIEVTGEYITSGDYGTEWVVTFPTQYLHVSDSFAGVVGVATEPFTVDETAVVGRSSEPVDFVLWNREEDEYIRSVETWYPHLINLDFQVNVLALNGSSNEYSDVLSSKAVRLNYPLDFDDGWGLMDFSAYSLSATSLDAPNDFVIGLPVLGFIAVADTVSSAERGGVFPLRITHSEH